MPFTDQTLKLAPPQNLVPFFDEAVSTHNIVKRLAIGNPGDGALVDGKAWKVKNKLKLYRVYNKSNPYSKMGNWWLFKNPYNKMTQEQFRKKFVVCAEWSPLDAIVQANIQPGAIVFLGNGQSGACKTKQRPQSNEQQVYVLNPQKAFPKQSANIKEKDMKWL